MRNLFLSPPVFICSYHSEYLDHFSTAAFLPVPDIVVSKMCYTLQLGNKSEIRASAVVKYSRESIHFQDIKSCPAIAAKQRWTLNKPSIQNTMLHACNERSITSSHDEWINVPLPILIACSQCTPTTTPPLPLILQLNNDIKSELWETSGVDRGE